MNQVKMVPYYEVERHPQVRDVLNIIGELGYVAGSAARGVIENEHDYNDIDIIAMGEADLPQITRLLDRAEYRLSFESETAMSFVYFGPEEGNTRTVQVLLKRVGRPEETLPRFPLTVQQFAVWRNPGTKSFSSFQTIHAHGAAATRSFTLSTGFNEHPAGFFRSAVKYLTKGYTLEDWRPVLLYLHDAMADSDAYAFVTEFQENMFNPYAD